MTSKNLINAIIEVNKAKDANKAEQDNARKKGDLILLSWLEKRHTELCEEIELKLQMATLLDQQGTNQINRLAVIEDQQASVLRRITHHLRHLATGEFS